MPHPRNFVAGWLLLLGTLLVLGGSLGFLQYQDYRQIDSTEQNRLASQTAVIEKNLAPQLALADHIIKGIINDIPLWQQQDDGFMRANHQLKVIDDNVIGISPLLVIDAQGDVIASSDAKLVGMNFRHREYFQTALKNPDPSILHVSQPFKTVLDTFVISLFRTIQGPGGEFAGIAIVSVVPEFFFTLLDSVRYTQDLRTSLIHSDGKLFLMAPNQPELAGKDLATPDTLFTRHRLSGRSDNVFVVPSTFVGPDRMVALRTIRPDALAMDKALVITASREKDAVFAAWRRGVYRQSGLFGALALVTSLGLLFHQRRQHANDKLVATQEAQRELARRALRDSEAYNKILFSDSHIALAVMDPEIGRLVDCNQALVDIYRMNSRDEVLALTPADVGAPLQYDGRTTMESVAEHVQAALRDGSHVFEWRHRRPDGELWDAEVHLMAFQHGDKTLLQFSLQDITERKRIEAELRVAAAAFDSQEGMIITDVDMKILRINRACSEITGYTAEEAIGQTPRMFSSGRHSKTFYQAMWASINHNGAWEGELWNRRKSGEIYPQWATISAVKTRNGSVSNYVASFIDISLRKTAEEEIKHLAFYDPLTRLPNRRLLLDRLRHALLASSRNDSAGALFFIDVDNFKTLNDTLGHDKGDLLLESVTRRLSAAVREEDTVARLGGDEFVIMMEGLSLNSLEAAAQARAVADKILDAFKTPHDLAGRSYLGTASIGITLFNHPADTVEELLKHADLAMYQAKAAGRNTVRFFDPQMQSSVMARTELEGDLREGLSQNQLVLHYQPQVDDNGRMSGAEALVRWQHPVRGMIPPMEFIGLAEETGLILKLGYWVLETACLQLVAWEGRADMAHLSIAVNVSAHQFRQVDFVEQVLAILKRTGANPHRLKLELTESLLVDSVEEVIAKMYALKARGVGFSLDDFGTGYSSLSYLKRLPLDQLKIDQSFVRDIHTDPNDAAIARTIVTLAHSLGLGVISEGVETAAQRDFLAHAGCHAHQGYFFSRPLPIDRFEAYSTQQTETV